MKLSFLSEAAWINERRVVAYPRIFLALYVVAAVILLALSPRMIDPTGKPVGTDFMDVWAAGRLALAHKPAAAYDYAQHFSVQQAALPWPKGQVPPFYGWHYPPMFLMVAAVLALFPYGMALLLWMAATLPVYLAAVRGILPRREATDAALGFPGAFITLGHGQNGFLTCGLLGGGLALLERRPYVAGILFGLLAYKPQFGVLLPLALLAGGHWRAIIAAGLTVTVTAGVSYILFGAQTWHAFFESLALTRHYVLEQGGTGWAKIVSIFSAVRMLGGSVNLAYQAQGAFALLAGAVVVWIWRKSASMEIKGAVLVTAALLATPYVLDYDLVLLALPIAGLAAIGLRDGFLPWEKIILLAAWLLPLFVRMIGQGLHVPAGPVVLMLLLWLAVRRADYGGFGKVEKTA